MEYIEKAKYELIMGLKNNESKEIIEVLNRYYKDMINIMLKIPIEEIKPNCKYLLKCKNVIEEKDKIEIFSFTNEEKILEFYNKYKDKYKNFYIIEIHGIDPENNFRPNMEIEIENWLKK